MDQASLNHLRHEDRKQLDILLAAINGAMNALRRDACGDWTITGSRGTIRASGGKFYVYIPCRSAVTWNNAKKKLASFTMANQDGDEEGVLVMSRMPNDDEAETLRSYVGLRQTREVSPEQIQKAREAVTKGTSGPYMRYSEPEAHEPTRGPQALNSGETSAPTDGGPHAGAD